MSHTDGTRALRPVRAISKPPESTLRLETPRLHTGAGHPKQAASVRQARRLQSARALRYFMLM